MIGSVVNKLTRQGVNGEMGRRVLVEAPFQTSHNPRPLWLALPWFWSHGGGLGFCGTRATHKVVHQEARGAEVLRGEQLAVRRGVGERQLILP